MGKFSTYRYLELKEDAPTVSTPVRTRSPRQTTRFQKLFLYLLVIMIFGCYTLSFLSGQSWLDKVARTLGYRSEHHYAVVIDAGSSGSRVLAYKFRVPFAVFGTPNLELEEEFFKQTKPGLSSYADDPLQGAGTIVNLIRSADVLVPASHRSTTPLIIRATAGLRLLPEEKANNLIESVRTAVRKLGFDSSPGVEIMDGADEGIFIWYTVNLLFNLLEGETMAALDLGGGSTQVTCEIDAASVDAYPKQDQFVVTHSKNITLYTHSYLKLGLYAARHGIFDMESTETPNHIVSSCVEPIIKNEQWVWNSQKYTVSGAPRPKGLTKEGAFNRCYDVVKRYVRATAGATLAPRGSVAAMSFYYDVAADAGIIDVMTGGVTTVSRYHSTAVGACWDNNVDQPWACVDLVLIYTLLHDLYDIPNNKPVHLIKKIDNHEVSWALGIAYNTIMSRLRENAAPAA